MPLEKGVFGLSVWHYQEKLFLFWLLQCGAALRGEDPWSTIIPILLAFDTVDMTLVESRLNGMTANEQPVPKKTLPLTTQYVTSSHYIKRSHPARLPWAPASQNPLRGKIEQITVEIIDRDKLSMIE